MPWFETPFQNAFVACLHRKPEGFCKSEGFFQESETFSNEVEGFFHRALVSYTHKFPKHGASSLTYLPHSRLGLPRSHWGLLCLHLSRNSGPAMEGFPNHSINFEDTYRILSVHVTPTISYTVLTPWYYLDPHKKKVGLVTIQTGFCGQPFHCTTDIRLTINQLCLATLINANQFGATSTPELCNQKCIMTVSEHN